MTLSGIIRALCEALRAFLILMFKIPNRLFSGMDQGPLSPEMLFLKNPKFGLFCNKPL